MIEVIELRGIAATAFENAESLVSVMMERFLVYFFRSDYRDIVICERLGKRMFLQNLCIRPPVLAIELGNYWRVIFNAHLVHPVFIAIERQ